MTERQFKLCIEHVVREKLEELFTEGRELLTEDQINWNENSSDEENLYCFKPIKNTQKTPNLKSYAPSNSPTDRRTIEYKDRSGNVVYSYRKTSSGSEYYLTHLGASPGFKKVIRYSNHWSGYLYTKYQVENSVSRMKTTVTCVFGTRQKIGDNYYAILLPIRYRNKITQEMVRKNRKNYLTM
jgi:hypothetical protein